MKYLIISPLGLSLFAVPRLCASPEVEKVYFSVLDMESKTNGKGMENYPGWEKFELAPQYMKIVNENSPSELTVFIDDVGIGEIGANLRKQGYKVIGGSPFTDKIEDARQYATDLMSRIMDVPESNSFTSFEEVINFLKVQDDEDKFVFKPNDADVPKEYTYVGKKGNKNLIEVVKAFKSEWKWKEDFQIQKIVKGTEVDFSAFFNGKEYIPNSMVLYFENKAFMNGDVGPATGGSIAVEVIRGPKGIFWDILQKLKPALQKANYMGQISLNCIVSDEDKKPYFLEFCGRVGYPSFPLDITLLEETGHNLHDLFSAMAKGETPGNLFSMDKIATTISVFVPPAPLEVNKDLVKGQLLSWDKKYDKYFWPYYVYYDKDKKKMALSGSIWVLQVTCADKTLDGALEMMYKTYLPTLELKNAEYRTDCGDSARERIKKLKEYGLL